MVVASIGRLPGERGFQIAVRETEILNCVLKRLTVGQSVKQPHPAERRSLGHDVDGQKTLVVRDLRSRRVETSEAALQTAQRNRLPERFHALLRSVGIRSVEMLRQSFVEPRRNTPRGYAGDDCMCQFVSQDLFEELRLLRGSRDRYPYPAVVLAA